MRPDPRTFELVLTGIYAGVSVAQVRDSTGWDLKVSAELTQIAPPTEAELAALRELVTRKTVIPAPAASTAPTASPSADTTALPASPAAVGVGE
jgi:hypothetical protein